MKFCRELPKMALMRIFLWSTLLVVIVNGADESKQEAVTSGNYPVKITDSGHDEVARFATAIAFFMEFSNEGDTSYKVTAIPTECCLKIEENDTDCSIMRLGRPASVNLASEGQNTTGKVVFLFRNLYARYRLGNCSFTISAEGGQSREWQHTVDFNTFPADQYDTATANNCSGVDQDPDRSCSPVDCAIKYKGKRNFYRNSTGKCEPVVPCNTRAKDGITVTGYYDWETNVCVQYEWFKNDNYLKQVESDTEIPEKVPTSSKSKNYADLEPKVLELQMKNAGKKIHLECNHGHQEGIYCECDKGWVSSGIHRDNPLKFHWCDVRKTDPNSIQLAPRKLSRPQELFAMVVLSLANFVLLFAWPYLLVKLACPNICQRLKLRVRMACCYCCHRKHQ